MATKYVFDIDVIHQDEKIYNELIKIHQDEVMLEDGYNMWWDYTIEKISSKLLKQLLCLDQDKKSFEQKYCLNAKIDVPQCLVNYLSEQEDMEKYLNDTISEKLNEKIKTIVECQLLSCESHFMEKSKICLAFQLEPKQKYMKLDYSLAGITLSGDQRYPEVHRNENQQGSCLYKPDLTPNMPYMNCRPCHWGIYWRRLKYVPDYHY